MESYYVPINVLCRFTFEYTQLHLMFWLRPPQRLIYSCSDCHCNKNKKLFDLCLDWKSTSRESHRQSSPGTETALRFSLPETSRSPPQRPPAAFTSLKCLLRTLAPSPARLTTSLAWCSASPSSLWKVGLQRSQCIPVQCVLLL